MSQKDILFDPLSLSRIVNHVEWEPTLHTYRDGSTNQERYVQSFTMLLERWIREYQLPELLDFAEAVGEQNFLRVIELVLDGMEKKLWQIRGFWEGLWYGANPKMAALLLASNTRPPGDPRAAIMPSDTPNDPLLYRLNGFFATLNQIAEPLGRISKW